jgi:hypothetical protein
LLSADQSFSLSKTIFAVPVGWYIALKSLLSQHWQAPCLVGDEARQFIKRQAYFDDLNGQDTPDSE